MIVKPTVPQVLADTAYLLLAQLVFAGVVSSSEKHSSPVLVSGSQSGHLWLFAIVY